MTMMNNHFLIQGLMCKFALFMIKLELITNSQRSMLQYLTPFHDRNYTGQSFISISSVNALVMHKKSPNLTWKQPHPELKAETSTRSVGLYVIIGATEEDQPRLFQIFALDLKDLLRVICGSQSSNNFPQRRGVARKSGAHVKPLRLAPLKKNYLKPNTPRELLALIVVLNNFEQGWGQIYLRQTSNTWPAVFPSQPFFICKF